MNRKEIVFTLPIWIVLMYVATLALLETEALARCSDGFITAAPHDALMPGPRLRTPWVNVRDFGALGDGVRDDTNAINCAIMAIHEKGRGGTVFFPEGIYKVQETSEFSAFSAAISLHGNIDYRGMGASSKIKLAPRQRASTRIMSTQRVSGDHDIRIMYLDIDGNRWNQDAEYEHQAGIFFAGAKNVTMDHVTVHDFVGDGVYAYVEPGARWTPSKKVFVRNSEFYYINRVAINFGETTDSLAENNDIHDNLGHCIKMEVSNNNLLEPVRLLSNTFKNNKCVRSAGFAFSPGVGYRIAGMDIVDNYFNDVRGPSIGFSENMKRLPATPCAADKKHQVIISSNVFHRNAMEIWIHRSAATITIKDNQIVHSGDSANAPINLGIFPLTGDTAAIKISDSRCFTISENFISSPNHHGIWLVSTSTETPTSAGKIVKNIIGNTRNHLWSLRRIFELNPAAHRTAQDILPNAIRILNANNILVEGNSIGETRGVGIVLLGPRTSRNKFRHNRIRANWYGGIRIMRDAGADNDFGNVIEKGENCLSLHNIRGTVDDKFGLRNEAPHPVSARGNWWGCTEGPGGACSAIRSPVLVGTGAGTVDFSNFLKSCSF